MKTIIAIVGLVIMTLCSYMFWKGIMISDPIILDNWCEWQRVEIEHVRDDIKRPPSTWRDPSTNSFVKEMMLKKAMEWNRIITWNKKAVEAGSKYVSKKWKYIDLIEL